MFLTAGLLSSEWVVWEAGAGVIYTYKYARAKLNGHVYTQRMASTIMMTHTHTRTHTQVLE